MDEDKYLVPYRLYVWLKWIGLIACPAVATFIGVIAPVWGFESQAIVTTITATGTLIGALLKYSEATGKSNEDGC